MVTTIRVILIGEIEGQKIDNVKELADRSRPELSRLRVLFKTNFGSGIFTCWLKGRPGPVFFLEISGASMPTRRTLNL